MATTAAQLVRDARSHIRNWSPAEVEAHLFAPDALLVDVREEDERAAQGTIAGSLHAPRGLLEFWADPDSPAHQPAFHPERRTILYCAAGSRSALAAQTLRSLGYRDVGHLDGGIAAWKQAGLPVTGIQPWYPRP